MISGALSRQQDERRLSIERRRFCYSNHIPERRSGHERRNTPAAFESDATMPVRLQLIRPHTR
ncbi:hypothetical protein [Desulfatitalea alkaliphila]|uniref:Uncharacterized protein n=1 Tax=Desulfatitalea alkaliphila TaxID=2929485 RepID=A0AA41UIL8_9BACT|nr:hypothetical protein [Desulfatitalea alkaliphila]MCJ8500234.1 hypothetical protein [Desulfatitalea alkaliphila]